MFLYISNGNIPSNWAHTVQIMKMSEAFDRHVKRFALLIATDVVGMFHGKRKLLRRYGITRPFPIRRLPLGFSVDPQVFERPNVREFARLARTYTRLTRPGLIYTRCHESAEYALADGFQVIFETHDGPGHPKTMRCIRAFSEFPNLKGVVTTSEVLKEAFVAEGLTPSRIFVRTNAVDLQRFSGIGDSPAEARRRIGLTPERPLVVYTGSLQAYKGIPTLLETAARMPEVGFLLVGGTDEQVSDWSEKASGIRNLLVRGQVDNAVLPDFLDAADICVVPNSRSDRTAAWTFSLKLYEYLAARRPTIVSDIPSLRGVVTDGKDALVVPPDDPHALAEGINSILNDSALASRLAMAGYDLVRNCTWERRAEDILMELAPEMLRADR